MFDESYEGNPLVNAMCVGLIDHDKIQKGVAQGVGNPVFYVGPEPDAMEFMELPLLLRKSPKNPKQNVQRYKSAIHLWKSW